MAMRTSARHRPNKRTRDRAPRIPGAGRAPRSGKYCRHRPYSGPGNSGSLLLPHISALPEVTPINVNTATPAVIESLAEFVDTGRAEELSQWSDDSWNDYPECAEPEALDGSGAAEITGNSREFYEDITDFVSDINTNQINPDDPKFENTDLISVQSNYFELRIEVEYGEINVQQISLLRRNSDGIVTVLQRARGDNLLQISGR